MSVLLRLTPLERLRRICGSQSEKALEIYDDFLMQMASDKVRDMLMATPEDRAKQSPEFKTFKNKAPAGTSKSPTRGRVKLPHLAAAGRGMITRFDAPWQGVRRIP